MNKIPPPYISNRDDNSCGQSVVRMILKHFCPDKEWTWKEADRICNAQPDKWTWTYKPCAELAKHGLDVTVYDTTDIKAFVRDSKKYLIERYGEKDTQAIIRNSYSLEQVAEEASEWLQDDLPVHQIIRPFTLEDVKKHIDQGALIYLWVNAKKLNHNEGYAGHFILVYDYTDTEIIFHDPGSLIDGKKINQIEGRKEKIDHLIKAATNDETGETEFMAAVKDGGVE